MKKMLVAIACMALLGAGLPGVSAGPTGGGFASDDVEWVNYVPIEAGSATGMNIYRDLLFVTSWKTFSIYDISDPINPALISTTPFGFKFENEDVATNGKIMLFSEQLPQNILHVWDVEDPSNPVEIGTLPGGGGHTSDCILNCKYSYASGGAIVDLRDPTAPEIVGNWGEGMPAGSAHDVNEVAPGLVLTSSRPVMLLDARKDPTKPKLLAVGDDESITGGIHSNEWPRRAKDKIVMFSSESNATGQCRGSNGAFMTWDASKWKKTGSFTLLDIYQLSNGTYADGSPTVNGLGCSAHWFQEHPTFKNGGLVAMGSYEHGTRFIDVSKKGKITEVGWFVPHAGSTSAAYWVTDELVYAIDYSRGIDILRWTGEV